MKDTGGRKGPSERLRETDKGVIKRGEVEEGRANQTCGG